MKQYDKVKILINDFSFEGVSAGMEGYIIEIYPDRNFEVEFSIQDTGKTTAIVVLKPSDVEEAE
jgi:hypothetical protein